MQPPRLGKYAVLRPLGRGGMAELWLARASGLAGFEKLVAVKCIRRELASDEELRTMFLDEARLAATLQHPNVVQVYDIGEEDGAFFLAMEYLEGDDLRSLTHVLRRDGKRMPLDEALAVVSGVCAGLHYAHERRSPDGKALGIVHRDVSPQNVVVTWDGGVKVVDFGIARAAKRASETRSGTLKGKVGYMSPEQCRGQTVDRRSDVFAIGILLWELTCGRRLFGGASEYDVLKRIVERDAPRPSLVSKDYPPELEQIVMRALQRDREARWPTAEALEIAIGAFARERRLELSRVRLGRFMRETLSAQAAAWTEWTQGQAGQPKDGPDSALERFLHTRMETHQGAAMPLPGDDEEPTAESKVGVRSGGTRAVALPKRRRRSGKWVAFAVGAAGAAMLGGVALWATRTPDATLPAERSRPTVEAVPTAGRPVERRGDPMAAPVSAPVATPLPATPTATDDAPVPDRVPTAQAGEDARQLAPPALPPPALPPPALPSPAHTRTRAAAAPARKAPPRRHGGGTRHAERPAHGPPAPSSPSRPAKPDLDAPLPPSP